MDRRRLLCVAVCIFALSHHTSAQQDAPSATDQDSTSEAGPPGTSPPKITQQSESYYVVVPRVPAEIECVATGTPEPTYRWQKDGVDVVIQDGFSLNGGNLVVKRPGETTNGLYRCFASNQYGVAISNKINFTVAFTDPFRETEPDTFTFDEGNVATIPCNQQASVPVPSVFWTDDANPGNEIVLDNRVSVDPNFNLRFSNIKLSDTGNYQCNVKNDKLRIQLLSPIKEVVVRAVESIDVRPATLVYNPPSTVQAFRTEKLRLKCMAEGYPTPTISWAKQDESLPADRMSYESYNQELVISDVIEADAGMYTCTADNGGGAPTSATTTVIVQSTPYWKNKPEDINIVIDDAGELICEAEGIPLPKVTWLINGVPSADAEPNPRITITEGQGGGSVEYSNAQTEDSAVFRCVATNEHGEIAASGFVNVESIPAQMTDAPDLIENTIEGKGFDLICAGQGSPKPVITWIFKGSPIVMDGMKYDIVEHGNSLTTTSALTVTGVSVNDTGTYTCSIENGFAAVTGDSRVIVRKGTKIIVGPGDEVPVKKGDTAIIACEVDHDAALDVTVTWSRDVGSGWEELDLTVSGGRFKHAKTGLDNLKILDTVVEDTGAYECKAVTDMDEAAASTQLVIQTVPAPPSGLSISERGDSSDTMAALSWNAGDDGNSPITEYVVSFETNWPMYGWQEIKTVPAASTQASLDLSPWVTYRFRVVAKNSIGNSEPSEVSKDYTTGPAAITTAPDTVGIEATDPGKMRVSWPKVDPYDQNGPGFKYVVRWREPGETEWTTEEIDNYETTSYEIDGGDIYKELEVEVFYANDEGPGPAAEQSGYTGEGTPTEAPQNVQVVAESPTGVLITWDKVPESSFNGQLRSFLVYYSTQDTQAQGQEPAECPPDADCRVDGLSPHATYEFQVAVKNGQREGPKSDPFILQMPQGPPGEVYELSVSPLSDRLYVKWGEPVEKNGVISGYNLSYQTVDGDDVGDKTEVSLTGSDNTSYKISPVEPKTYYRIEVVAINGAGPGAMDSVETSTRVGGAPKRPQLADGQIQEGINHINVTFIQPKDGAAANQFYIRYKEANNNKVNFENTKPMDLFDGEQIKVAGLKPGTEYALRIVAVNDDGEATSDEVVGKTSGTGTVAASPIYVQGWFIALLIIIVALLCILLVLCILKSQRGGKYNVSDKEQQRKGDIESTPLKDDGGFEEFEPRKDNPDGELPRGSQGSLRDSEPGSSDTDSLKEYADGELGKFNEEGSFIGQYGDKKQRPPDEGEQGGAAYSTFV